MRKIYSHFIILFLFIGIGACKKDKDPKKRIEIKDATYSLSCLNCEEHSSNGVLYTYSSFNIAFKYSDPKETLTEDSYLKVKWVFNDGSSGDFIVAYNKLSIIEGKINSIVFNSIWHFDYTDVVHLDMTLYSGRGSKSNTLGVDIYKPTGAAKIKN